MERIRLTKNEKTLFLALAQDLNPSYCMAESDLDASASGLERKGLAHCAWVEGHTIESISLTNYGKAYFATNPNLYNPLSSFSVGDYSGICWVAIISNIILIIALLVIISK